MKKREYLKIWVDIPIFGAHVLFLFGELKKVKRFIPSDLRGDFDGRYIARTVNARSGTSILSVVHLNDADIATVAHEAVHVIGFIYEVCGIKYLHADDETFAYLMSYIVHEVDEKLFTIERGEGEESEDTKQEDAG